ncbi:hypothetical protein AAGT00_00515 (plasmid) [Streptomyces cavourensis]
MSTPPTTAESSTGTAEAAATKPMAEASLVRWSTSQGRAILATVLPSRDRPWDIRYAISMDLLFQFSGG